MPVVGKKEDFFQEAVPQGGWGARRGHRHPERLGFFWDSILIVSSLHGMAVSMEGSVSGGARFNPKNLKGHL